MNYLKHFMESNSFQLMLMNETHGAAIKNVASVAVLKKIKIPLPPLAEQKRIAELLDTADRILKQRESAIAKLDQLAQSVFVEMFGNVSNNSKKWQIKDFSELADNEDYKRKPIKSSDRDNRGGAYPYYGASGIIDTIDEYIYRGKK